jgi:electron transfer flavoprotein beta subunit
MGIRVIVCVEQVMDTQVPLQIVEESNLVVQSEPQPVYFMNPADRCGLEEAMNLKQGPSTEVIAITVGPACAEGVLRTCLARGADSGIHVRCSEGALANAWATATILAREIENHPYDLIICGDQSLDNGEGQVGPILAELLNLPQVTRVIALEIKASERRLVAKRWLERGAHEIVESPVPALITVMAVANEPRYVSVNRHQLVSDTQIVRREVLDCEGNVELLCQIAGRDWPRPRPKKIAMPEATMSAADRMNFLMSGGRAQKGGGSFLGSTDKAVELVMEFLRERGFLERLSGLPKS